MDNLPLYNDDTAFQGTVATDRIDDVHYPRSKVGFGADGSYVDVSTSDPLPVAALQSGTWAVTVADVDGPVVVTDGDGSLTVDGAVSIEGTVAVSPAEGFAVQINAPLPEGTNVLGSVTQSGAWTVDTELPAAATLGDATANPSLPSLGALGLCFNGSTWDRVRGDTTHGLDVDVTRVTGSVTVVQSAASSLKTTADLALDGSAVGTGNPLPVWDAGSSLTVDGTVAATQSGTWNIGTLSTITNVVHVDDNGGSLTVDGEVAATQAGTWNVGTVATITNVVHVDDNGESLTVDGEVAATQSGTWNVGTVATITNVVHVDDNSGALTVDNDGTFAVQVTGTALSCLQLLDDVVFAEDVAATTGDKGVQVLTVRRDTAAASAGTDGDYQPPITDAAGRLWVNASGVAVPVTDNGGSLTVDGSVAVSGTVSVSGTVTVSGTVETELPAAAAAGDGESNPTVPRVGSCLLGFNGSTWDRLRSDVTNGLDVDVSRVQGTVAVTQSGAWSVSLGAAVPAGSNVIGGVTQSGAWSVGLAAGTNSVGRVVPEASASGTGTSAYRNASLSNSVQDVKTSSGRVYGIHCFNPNGSEAYLQLYDASAPTVGTTTPTRTYAVPGRGWLTLDLTVPQAYATAIKVAATTTAGGGTAPTSGLLIDVEWL